MEEVIEQKEVQISQAEWLLHYKAWQKSPLSKREYCRGHNLKADNFYSWCYRFKKKEERDGRYNSDVFIPIIAKEVPVDSNDKISAEILLPNAVRLKMSLHPKMLLKLIRDLNDAATVIR